MKKVRTPANRLSSKVKEKVMKYGSWFIQYPQFTYIRVEGSTICPKRLPRYPSKKVILMKLARQLENYDRIMKLKGEIGIFFLFRIGNDSCPNPIAFAAVEKECKWYHISWYRERKGFDLNGLIKASHENIFKHVPTIEDFWANAEDDFHVRKLAFSRL